MRVLSLYDGMSCGMLAFLRAGIPVESYDAYEIDKHAIKVSQHNFPQIVQHGDVFKGDFASYKGKVDAVVGGSPCFVAGTMVLTSEGMKPIEQVRVGDLVYTHRHRFRPVTAVGNKTAQVFRMVSDGVPDILVTDNHPFYVSRMTLDRYGARQFSEPSWKAVGELIPDSDFLSSPIVMGSYNPRGLTVGHCRLLAMMLASRRITDGYREWMAEVSEENHRDTADWAPVMELVSENSLPFDPDHREIPVEILQLPQELAHAFMGAFLECAGKRDEADNVWTYKARSPAMAHSLALLAQKVYETPGIIVRDTVYRGCDDGSVTPVPVWTVTVGYGTDRMVSGRRICNDLYTPFRSLEPRGEDTVYNLSVEQDESYLAGNRIVHNCTYWSIAQSKHRETEAHGIGWELFQQYVRAVRESEPRFFVYENNKSMAKAIREEISNTFGFEPICINSALVSAQNRQRLYWVGIRDDDGTYRKASIEQPVDRGILLKDVLDGNFRRNLSEKEVEYMVRPTADGRNHFDYGHHADVSKDKSPCITACLSKGVPYNVLVEPVAIASRKRDFQDGSAGKKFEANGPKANCLTTVQTDCMVAINVDDPNEIPLNSSDGKSRTLMAGYGKFGMQTLIAQKGWNGGTTAVAEPIDIPSESVAGRIVGRRIGEDGRRKDNDLSIDLVQRPEVNDDPCKTNCLTTVGKDNIIIEPLCEPVNVTVDGKGKALTACYYKTAPRDAITEVAGGRSMVAEPIRVGLMPRSDGEVFDRQGTRIYDPDGKSITLSGDGGGAKEKTGLYAIPAMDAIDGHHASGGSAVIGPIPLNITGDGKSQCIRATCYKDGIRNLVANDVERRTCVAHDVTEFYGVGQSVHPIGSVGNMYGRGQNGQLFGPDSKTKTLSAGTGQNGRGIGSNNSPKAILPYPQYEGQTIYEVRDGHITINGRTYPIKLKDGRYIIRKLSVDECKRLQTVPEWYDMSCISKSQAYKCLGNGWTIEVIAHLIQGAVRELDPDFVPTEVGAEPTAKAVTLDSFTEVSP